MDFIFTTSKDIQRLIWRYLSINDAVIVATVCKEGVENVKYSKVWYPRVLFNQYFDHHIPTLPQLRYVSIKKVCCAFASKGQRIVLDNDVLCKGLQLNLYAYIRRFHIDINIQTIEVLIINGCNRP